MTRLANHVLGARGAFDSIELLQIAFGAHTTLDYAEDSSHTGGTLMVSDGIPPLLYGEQANPA
jgi:hypothetical protein